MDNIQGGIDDIGEGFKDLVEQSKEGFKDGLISGQGKVCELVGGRWIHGECHINTALNAQVYTFAQMKYYDSYVRMLNLKSAETQFIVPFLICFFRQTLCC